MPTAFESDMFSCLVPAPNRGDSQPGSKVGVKSLQRFMRQNGLDSDGTPPKSTKKDEQKSARPHPEYID